MTDLPKPGIWTASPRILWREQARRRALATVYIALGYAFLFAAAGLLMHFLSGVAFVFVLPFFLARTKLRAVASTEDLKLMEDPEDDSVALVSVTIRADHRRIGIDHGAMWIADNLIHFRGRCCYFALAGNDFRWVKIFPIPRFGLRHPELSVDLVFEPISWPGDPGSHRAKYIIGQAVKLANTNTLSDEPRTYPPFVHWRTGEVWLEIAAREQKELGE